MFFQKTGWATQISMGRFVFNFYTYDSLFQQGAESTYLTVHNHCGYELQMINEGSYTLFLDDREYELSAGQVCVISPYCYHSFLRCTPADGANRYSLRFTIQEQDGGETGAFDFGRLFRSSFVCHPSPVIFSLVKQMEYEVLRREIWCEDSVRSLITCILVYISQAIASEDTLQLPAYQESGSFQAETAFRINAMEAFFSRRSCEDVSLQDLARVLSLSPRQTANLIREYYGTSFTRCVLRTRLENVKALLRYTDRTLDQIARDTGFETPNYFYSSFKKLTGMTPRAYRLQFRKALEEPLL